MTIREHFHGRLPHRRVVIFLRQRRDVLAGVAQGHKLAAVHLDRILERPPQL
jgi:hypothetical protein